MISERDRPSLLLISSHWLSLLGTVLVTTAVISWLFVLPIHLRGHADNPYIGLLVFLIIPVVFFAGLVLIPIGVFLAKRRIRKSLPAVVVDRRKSLRRLLGFLGGTTLVNVIIGTQLTYRAVHYMDTAQFCGESCHVMKPEFSAHQNSPHSRVLCVECHVAPGAAGWFESKKAGTRQLIEVVRDNYPRPIPSALESGRLVPSRYTCEQCHWPQKIGTIYLRVIPKYADDEANTSAETVLLMFIGGGKIKGIHGSHLGPGIRIRFAAADSKRQTIPWVEYRNTNTGDARIYLAEGVKPDSVHNLPRHTMECVDCHNRPTHTFELADRAVNRAIALGEIPSTLPFIKKKSVEVLKASYSSSEEAARKIPSALQAYYQQSYPAVYAQRSQDVSAAAQSVVAIYNRNIFPDLKVTWGTYPNNLGHTDFPGCFRCHDEAHATSDKRTITQDCNTCHQPLAIEEASPEILKSLGLDERIANLRRP
jgi:hypothetical protein